MKKLTFLLLFVMNYCYAQYQPFKLQHRNNTTSSSSYSSNSSQYEPFKLQRRNNTTILQQSFDKMEALHDEATDQYSKLQIMLEDFGDQLNNDKATLIWFDNYKKEIANTFKALSNQSWGEARNYAIRMQGEIVNDPELIARVRTSKEYQAQLKSIQERKDMSNEEKVKWILNHPYRFIPILNNEGRIVGGKLGTN